MFASLLTLHAVVIALGVLAGVGWARRARQLRGHLNPDRLPHEVPHLWFLVPLPLLLLACHAVFQNSRDLQWDLPFLVQYWYGPISWTVVVAVLSYVFSLGTAVYYQNAHPQRRQVVLASALLVLAIELYAFQLLRPDPPELSGPWQTPDGIILQSSGSTCVPAAAANVVRSLGVNVDERKMSGLCGTSVDGTSPGQLVMAMRRLGFTDRKVHVHRDGIEAVRPPAVIFLRGDTHAVALMRARRGRWEIWDPGHGRLVMDAAGVTAYTTNAHAIEFRREPRR